MYTVRNICGGGEEFRDLAQAIEAAGGHMREPYVESARGRRPVYDGEIGDWGETYDDMRDRIDPPDAD